MFNPLKFYLFLGGGGGWRGVEGGGGGWRGVENISDLLFSHCVAPTRTNRGPLMGAPNVACRFKEMAMSPVVILEFSCRFYDSLCHLSILRNGNVPCR